jgi:hypothetical protein
MFLSGRKQYLILEQHILAVMFKLRLPCWSGCVKNVELIMSAPVWSADAIWFWPDWRHSGNIAVAEYKSASVFRTGRSRSLCDRFAEPAHNYGVTREHLSALANPIESFFQSSLPQLFLPAIDREASRCPRSEV